MRRPASERNLPNAGLRGRRFHVIGGGGAYGQCRAAFTRDTSSRSLTPCLGPNSSLSSLRAAKARIKGKRTPVPQVLKRPLQRATSFARKPKQHFSPEYLRELGDMLRLQVRSESSRSTETQASRGSFPRRLAQLVTSSQWPGSNGQ